jgi:uncharacterized protein (TIGR03435 family)
MRTVCAALIAAGSVSFAQAPPPAATPSFDVVSIKRSTADTRGYSYGWQPGGHWAMKNTAVIRLIRSAYPAVRDVVTAPEWLTSERYDVTAKAEGTPTLAQIEVMLQRLLADRFRFVAHEDMQERPVFALVVAAANGKPGPALVPSTIDCDAIRKRRLGGEQVNLPVRADGGPACGWNSDGETYRFGGIPMSRLATETLARVDDRFVVDRTGLTGTYDFTLRYAIEPKPGSELPSLFTALQEQLGLKLVPDRARVPVLVIDRIERPTPD